MDARENLLRLINFDGPDYIPMTFHINSACWHHYPHQALFDLMASHPVLFPDFDDFELAKQIEYPPFARADEKYTDPWGCVWETTDDGIVGVVTEHPFKTWDGFENFEPPDPNKVNHMGPIDWKLESVGNGPAISQTCIKSGQVGHNHTWLRLIDIRGYENVLFDMADDEPRLYKLLEMLENFNMGLVRNYIDICGAKWMGFAEDLGMQTGPMLSPQYFRKYIKPSYKRLFKAAIDSDCIVHVHTDGDIREFTDDLIDCGVKVLNMQDMVNGIGWIKENLKGRICIDLDIDRQAITVDGTPEQIDALIREEVAELGSKEGGLMMIYGLYPGVPLENAKAVMDAMEKYSIYYS